MTTLPTRFRSPTCPKPLPGQPLQSWYWNFGDGATSTSQNPVHAYDKPGTYNVLQSVTTVCGSDYTKKASFTVTVDCTLPAGVLQPM